MADAADRAAVDIDRIINTPRRVRLDQEGLDVLAATIRVHQDAEGVAELIMRYVFDHCVSYVPQAHWSGFADRDKKAIAELIKQGRNNDG